jgi:hypothetical protein
MQRCTHVGVFGKFYGGSNRVGNKRPCSVQDNAIGVQITSDYLTHVQSGLFNATVVPAHLCNAQLCTQVNLVTLLLQTYSTVLVYIEL